MPYCEGITDGGINYLYENHKNSSAAYCAECKNKRHNVHQIMSLGVYASCDALSMLRAGERSDSNKNRVVLAAFQKGRNKERRSAGELPAKKNVTGKVTICS